MSKLFSRTRLFVACLTCIFAVVGCGGDSEAPVVVLSCEPGSAGDACAPYDEGTYCAGSGAEPVACGDETWDHDADPATECVAWGECEPGEYVTGEGSATQDRGCQSCLSGSYSSEANADSCREWSACESGECIANEGTATDDQTCTACPSQTFSDQSNASSCQDWTDCEAGEFIAEEASATSDRVCEICADGTHTEVTNSSQCQPHGECAAGTVQTAPGSETTSPTCEDCLEGNYCAGGDAPAVPCEEGTWDHDGNPASECVAWTVCQPGEFEEQPGSTTDDRSCSGCEAGSFSSSENAPSCEAWTVCEPSEYVTMEGSESSDRQCTSCEDGTYSTAENASSCEAWKDCAPGEYVAASGSSTDDRQCSQCSSGYTTTENAAECMAWTTCEPGEYVTVAASESSDRACASCEVGTYTNEENQSSCEAWTACEPGEYVATSGSSTGDRQCSQCSSGYTTTTNAAECASWTTCEPGEYVTVAASESNDRECGSCEDGTYSTAENATSCEAWTDCVPGEYVGDEPTATTDRVCMACSDGTYSETVNSASCAAWSECQPGEFAAVTASAGQDRECETCAEGFYTTTSNEDSCQAWTECAPGQYVASSGGVDFDRQCSSCDAGTFTDTTNADSCEDWSECVSGEYVATAPTLANDRICATCESGSFADTINTDECTDWTTCLDGEYVDIEGAETMDQQCASCPDGLVSAGPNAPSCETASWQKVFAGSRHNCAIAQDDTLWCWGSGGNGRLGIGSTDDHDAPQQVGADDSGLAMGWESISPGSSHSCAIRDDSTLWCWGSGDDGRLGQGDLNLDDEHRPAQVTIGGTTGWETVSAGNDHSCAIRDDSTLWCWGSSDDGQLGLGEIYTDARTFPDQILEDDPALATGWESVSTGSSHTCATRSDGTLWCWGAATYGQLGLGDTDEQDMPQQVLAGDPELEDGWDAVTAASSHTCAMRQDDTLWCWGSGGSGSLGLGDMTTHHTPQQVLAGDAELETGWKNIITSSTGGHTCAMRQDDTLWCWGSGHRGQLGLGERDNLGSPQQLFADTGAASGGWETVSLGALHSCAIKSGALQCWGHNDTGQLGIGIHGGNKSSPAALDSTGDFVTSSAGGRHNCAIADDSTLWCWGNSTFGRLGIGSGGEQTTPQQVLAGDSFDAMGWADIAAGDEHSCATSQDGTLWCWGRGSTGRLGLGDSTNQDTPQQVFEDDTMLASGWETVTAGGTHTCAIRQDGTLWCWGGGSSGQLGLGDYYTVRETPQQVFEGDENLATGWASISAGAEHTCATRDDATLWCWGNGGDGRLGQGNFSYYTAPQQVMDGDSTLATGWASVSAGTDYTCATREDATLWCWGSSFSGKLGTDGTASAEVTPQQVMEDDAALATGWASVSAADEHTCGTRETGTLWCWGNGNYGRLGLGDLDNQYAPHQLGDETDWIAVSAGNSHTHGIRAGGSVFSWGQNLFSQLGDGTRYRTLPTAVVSP